MFKSIDEFIKFAEEEYSYSVAFPSRMSPSGSIWNDFAHFTPDFIKEDGVVDFFDHSLLSNIEFDSKKKCCCFRNFTFSRIKSDGFNYEDVDLGFLVRELDKNENLRKLIKKLGKPSVSYFAVDVNDKEPAVEIVVGKKYWGYCSEFNNNREKMFSFGGSICLWFGCKKDDLKKDGVKIFFEYGDERELKEIKEGEL